MCSELGLHAHLGWGFRPALRTLGSLPFTTLWNHIVATTYGYGSTKRYEMICIALGFKVFAMIMATECTRL